jgi:hypothetical protein
MFLGKALDPLRAAAWPIKDLLILLQSVLISVAYLEGVFRVYV